MELFTKSVEENALQAYVQEGTGQITVNKTICNLFPTATLQ
jgi:hypothetical protein